jgi:hypothetical protein
MLYKHLFKGGVQYMLPIYILGVVAFILTAFLFYKVFSSKETKPEVSKKLREWIFFLGSLAFMWGIFGQTMDIMQIMTLLAELREPVHPSLFAGGFGITLIAPAYGIAIFIFSYIVWFIARMKTKK